uniref:hypothetical protein n=1 Tax=Alloprevotella sp. TaxID=1872471 RepID=UPI004027B87B
VEALPARLLGGLFVSLYRVNAALFRRVGGALPLRSQRCFVASAMLFVLAVWAWGLRAVLSSVLQSQAQ